MVNLDDNKANTLLTNPIQFKIFCAEKYLEEMLTFVPLDIFPQKKIMAEITIECFLFYIVGAIDMIFQDINKKLKLEIPSHQVRSSNVIKELKSNKTNKAKIVLDHYEKYFQEPIHTEKIISDQEYDTASDRYGDDTVGFLTEYENRNTIKYRHFWNRKNSILWELRNQRNLITHDSLLKNVGLRGTVESKDYVRIRLVYNDRHTKIWDSIHYENPKDYYVEALNNAKQFINDIQYVLQ